MSNSEIDCYVISAYQRLLKELKERVSLSKADMLKAALSQQEMKATLSHWCQGYVKPRGDDTP